MLQLTLASAGFGLVVALMIRGSLTRNAVTKRVLFWPVFAGVASASYLFSRQFVVVTPRLRHTQQFNQMTRKTFCVLCRRCIQVRDESSDAQLQHTARVVAVTTPDVVLISERWQRLAGDDW